MAIYLFLQILKFTKYYYNLLLLLLKLIKKLSRRHLINSSDVFLIKGFTVLYSTVFYCILLYSTVFYCILLYSTVFYCILLNSIVFYCILLYSTVLYCILATVFYYILLYYTVFYCIILHSSYRILLYSTVFYCADFSYQIGHLVNFHSQIGSNVRLAVILKTYWAWSDAVCSCDNKLNKTIIIVYTNKSWKTT